MAVTWPNLSMDLTDGHDVEALIPRLLLAALKASTMPYSLLK
ncbi:MAG: hypothetical protein ACTXOO_00960 [Sodalis sp. (in: enterobacteria)]